MHAVATTPVGLPGLHRSYSPVSGGLPRYPIGSAPTLYVSRPAQRSLALRPACVLSRHRDPFTSECFSAIRCLLSPLRLLPAGTTSCRVGLSPTGDRRLCTAHRIVRISCQFDGMPSYRTFPSLPQFRSHGRSRDLIRPSGRDWQSESAAVRVENSAAGHTTAVRGVCSDGGSSVRPLAVGTAVVGSPRQPRRRARRRRAGKISRQTEMLQDLLNGRLLRNRRQQPQSPTAVGAR